MPNMAGSQGKAARSCAPPTAAQAGAQARRPWLTRWIERVEFTDAAHGWVLVDNGWGEPAVYATVDGGDHWGAVPAAIDTDGYVTGLSFIDDTHGWLSADGGGILQTADGGGIGPLVTSKVVGTAPRHHGFVDRSVTLSFSDQDDGLGAQATQYRLNGSAWATASSLRIPAPHDHTNDGIKTILYRAIDGSDNVGPTKVREIVVDTGRPRVLAPKAAVARSGGLAKILVGAQDSLSPWVRIRVAVRDASGHTVMLKHSWVVAGDLRPRFTYVTLRCNAASGHYRLVVTGTDWAGNRQVRVVYNRLHVYGVGALVPVNKAKDAAVVEGIHTIQVGIQSWAVDHGDLFPPVAKVSKAGLGSYVDNWPKNPFTGKPMAAGSAVGDYTYRYLDSGASFRLSGHLSTGTDFVVP